MSESATVSDAVGCAPLSSSSSDSLGKCKECGVAGDVFCPDCNCVLCLGHSTLFHRFASFAAHKPVDLNTYFRFKRGLGDSAPSDKEIEADAENRLCFFNPYNDRITLTPRLGKLYDDPNARPSLVSFIGPSGVGKSTLIRFLISLYHSRAGVSMPLPGLPKGTQSTSADIHVYNGGLVPNSFHGKGGVDLTIPLAFVDSEGLHGSEEPRSIGHLWNSIRDVLPADAHIRDYKSFLKKRSEHVRESYPRLLYTFSDVVCFVFCGDWKQRQSILEPLLSWGRKAASDPNQNIPQLIIIINKDVPESEAEKYDDFVAAYEEWIMGDPYGSELGRLFTRPQVVLIPSLNVSFLVAIKRLELLRDTIFQSVIGIRDRRESIHQLFTHRELQRCMEFAANTFSKDVGAEFDIYKAAVALRPTSVGVGAIASFRREVERECPSDLSRNDRYALSLNILRERFPWAVLLGIGRLGVRVAHGGPEAKLPQHLQVALEKAQLEVDGEMPCSANKRFGEEICFCNSVRSAHKISTTSSTHSRSTTSFTHSSTDSVRKDAQSWDGPFEFRIEVQDAADSCRLVSLAESALRAASALDVREIRNSLNEVRKRELQKFGWFRSPSFYLVCTCCMLELPTEVLSCGHIICSLCAKEEVEMLSEGTDICCPVCFSKAKFCPNYLPSPAGYRILSLDGGGVRGIVELLSLQKLMSYFDGMHVEDLFDIVVGTSAGGIIALALTVHSFNGSPKRLPEVIKLFEGICGKVFAVNFIKDVCNKSGATDLLQLLGLSISKYSSKTLEEQLEKHLGTDLLVQSCVGGPRVIVTSCLPSFNHAGAWFTSYIRAELDIGDGGLSNVAHRKKGDPEKTIPTWGRVADSYVFTVKDVATATSAATTYFPAYSAGDRSWVDGGLRFNCPAAIALQEGRAIWPDQSVSAFISLGSGKLSETKSTIGQLIFDLVSILTDSASQFKTATDMLDEHSKHCYVRLNPEINETCDLDEVKKILLLKTKTEKYLSSDAGQDVVSNAANILFAALFYLELEDSKFRIRSRAALPTSLQTALTASSFEVEVPTAPGAISTICWEDRKWEQNIMNLPLSITGFPLERKQEVHVKLKTVLPNTKKPKVWPLPISGTPLKIQ